MSQSACPSILWVWFKGLKPDVYWYWNTLVLVVIHLCCYVFALHPPPLPAPGLYRGSTHLFLHSRYIILKDICIACLAQTQGIQHTECRHLAAGTRHPTTGLCWDFAAYLTAVLSYDIAITTEKAHLDHNVSEKKMKNCTPIKKIADPVLA